MTRTSITDLIPNLDPKTTRSVDEIFANAGITDQQAASLMRAVVLGYNAGGNDESLRNTQLEQELLDRINGQIDTAALAENVHAGIYYGYDVTAAVEQFANDFGDVPGAFLNRHPDIADRLNAIGIELTTVNFGDGFEFTDLLHYTLFARSVGLDPTMSSHVTLGPDLTGWEKGPFGRLFGIRDRVTDALRGGAALLRLGAPDGEPKWWVGIGTNVHPDLVASHLKQREEHVGQADAVTASLSRPTAEEN